MTTPAVALPAAGALAASPLRAPAAAAGPGSARDAARGVEATLLTQAFERLIQDAAEGPLGGAGAGAGIWRGLLAEALVGHVARAGGVGLSAQVERELIALRSAS